MGNVISQPTVGGVSIPFPDEATIEPVWIYGENITLGGKTRRDVMARKYKYSLSWKHMDVTYYNALEAIINGLVAFTFIYDKWPQSTNPGISCLGTLSARRLEYGIGDTSYLSSVNLVLIEVESRI